jgi:transposase InsO family protein
MSNMPNCPWEQVDIDLYVPTPSNTDLLVLVDQYPRYAVVKEVNSKTPEYVIPILHDIWSTFGIQVVLKSDNGPPFTSIEFSNMCKFFGIKHQLITPYWPRANGEVERFN